MRREIDLVSAALVASDCVVAPHWISYTGPLDVVIIMRDDTGQCACVLC